jgi:hypothetical protein
MGIDSILNLPNEKVIRALIILLVMLSTGLTMIFIFFNPYIYDLDSIKLILLSITFSTPNIFGCYWTFVFDKIRRKGKNMIDITEWMSLSFIVFYLHLLIFYLLSIIVPYQINFLSYWITYVIFLIVFTLTTILFP